MTRRRAARVAILWSLATALAIAAQEARIEYPRAAKGTVVDDYFGTKVVDPYRWMEDLNAPELKTWIDAENAITFKYLDALPDRDGLKKRITELWNYPKVGIPRFLGRHWFYTRNTGLQRQSVIFVRETMTGPEKVAIDPNELSPDGSTALAYWLPSPDG